MFEDVHGTRLAAARSRAVGAGLPLRGDWLVGSANQYGGGGTATPLPRIVSRAAPSNSLSLRSAAAQMHKPLSG